MKLKIYVHPNPDGGHILKCKNKPVSVQTLDDWDVALPEIIKAPYEIDENDVIVFPREGKAWQAALTIEDELA